jgi:2-methylcitrate dehydratase PrpD
MRVVPWSRIGVEGVTALDSAGDSALNGGWLAVFGEGHRIYPEDIYKGLGILWETERIAVKAYACMGLLHAAIDAALADGSTRVAKVVHPRGTGDRNLTNADIQDKYAKLTHRVISAERQAAIEKAILHIDTLDDVSELTALLTPAVHSPLD